MNTQMTSGLVALLLALPMIMLAVRFESQLVDWAVGLLLAVVSPARLADWLSARRTIVTMALVMSVAGAQAQSQHAPPGGYTYGATEDGVDVLPILPADCPPATGIALIPAMILAGAAVGVVGFIGIKAVDKVLDIEEMIVTNNAAQPGLLVMSPEYQDYVKNGFTVVPVVGRPAFTAPDIDRGGPIQTYPMPVSVEWSQDGMDGTWVEVKHGITIGDEWEMPDTGVWRAKVIPTKIGITDGDVTVTAPPGVLETSSDLTNWQEHSINTEDTLVTATPGVFYRVRL